MFVLSEVHFNRSDPQISNSAIPDAPKYLQCKIMKEAALKPKGRCEKDIY